MHTIMSSSKGGEKLWEIKYIHKICKSKTCTELSYSKQMDLNIQYSMLHHALFSLYISKSSSPKHLEILTFWCCFFTDVPSPFMIS